MSHKINYVCIACSATFTRRTSAIRHSTDIHAGTAFFVRLIDYIVGRVQGRYLPSSPLSNRQRKKNEQNLINLHSLLDRNPAALNKIPTSRFTVRLDETKKDEYSKINSSNESIESDLPKYQELATLVRKYNTKEDANQLLCEIKRCYLERKDSLIDIDEWLEFFRNIDRNRRI
jgi:hypothetical protein